jgi:hypothetical protein
MIEEKKVPQISSENKNPKAKKKKLNKHEKMIEAQRQALAQKKELEENQ